MSFFIASIQRAHRLAFAHHLERHALADVALRPRPSWIKRFGGPAQHVDEARRHREAAGIDVDCRGRTAQVSDGRDLIAANTYVDPRTQVRPSRHTPSPSRMTTSYCGAVAHAAAPHKKTKRQPLEITRCMPIPFTTPRKNP